MVRIRLTRVGKKNAPAYRVVIADQRKAVKRKFIEIIGHYNPTFAVKELVIDKDRALFWLERGAMPTPTVQNLMVDLGIMKDKINIKYAKKIEKEEPKAEPVATAEEGVTEEITTEEPVETATETAATEPETQAESTEEQKEE